VRASTQTQIATGDPHAPGYGYQWWTLTEQGHRGFAALGLGGQLVEVLPDLDLVVVLTSEVRTVQDVRTGSDSRAIVGDVVVPAVNG
jgi:CubicO group peptidase (beta-lactamase class C family)